MLNKESENIMGKKKIRKTYNSKGERSSVSRVNLSLAKSAVSEVDRALNKVAAWKAGKNPWITVPGPSKNMSMVRKRANDMWGDPRYAFANIFGKMKGDE